MLWIYVVDSAVMATHQTGQQHVVDTLFKIHARAGVNPIAAGVAVFPTNVCAWSPIS